MTTAFYLEPGTLQGILDILKARGYTIIGPKVQASAVVLDAMASLDTLPLGWRDQQAPGVYAINKSADTGFFQYTCGPHSWKRYLYPPHMRLFGVCLEDGGVRLEQTDRPVPAYAFFGMRACDLKAMAILDRVLSEHAYPDPDYQAIRQNLFIIAVNCLQPGGTCFCAAMGAGPRVESGYDIVLNEICEPDRHRLIAEPGSRQGADVLSAVNCVPTSTADMAHVRRLSDAAAVKMKGTPDLPKADSLFSTHFEHLHWKTLEKRCLACGNCTLVCPTCFCHTITDLESLDGRQAERQRVWDSCFSKVFSYIHNGSIHTSIASRYRQWLGHKLVTWQEQFGTPGCVGCGRCRTWCPAGIDLVEEARMVFGDELH